MPVHLSYQGPERISPLCPSQVRILPLLSMSSQNTASAAHVESVHYHSCLNSIRIPHLLSQSKSDQYTIHPINVLSVCNIACCLPADNYRGNQTTHMYITNAAHLAVHPIDALHCRPSKWNEHRLSQLSLLHGLLTLLEYFLHL